MMDEEEFKKITNDLWKKINRGIILSTVGMFSLTWFILKYMFSDKHYTQKGDR